MTRFYRWRDVYLKWASSWFTRRKDGQHLADIAVKLSSVGWVHEYVDGGFEAILMGVSQNHIYSDKLVSKNMNGKHAVLHHFPALK